MMHGYYSYMKQARLWELAHAIKQPDLEAAKVRGNEGKRAA